MKARLRGRARVAGDWVSALDIVGSRERLPARETLSTDLREVLGRLGAADASVAEPGDILVAGIGFGAGTRDDTPAWLLRRAGVAAVVCGSANRAFQASALRVGLPVLVLARASSLIAPGSDIILNLEGGTCEVVDLHRMLVGSALARDELRVLAEEPGAKLLDLGSASADPDVLAYEPGARPRKRS